MNTTQRATVVIVGAVGLFAAMWGLASWAATPGSRVVLKSDGNYSCQRCYAFGKYDCHDVGHTDGSLKDALAEYTWWEKPMSEPIVVQVIKP